MKISEDELAEQMASFGIPDDYGRLLAKLDTAIKNGAEERLNSVVSDVTGREAKSFEDFVRSCIERGVWVKN